MERILLLPANIYAALNHVNLKTASNDGDGQVYLVQDTAAVFLIGLVHYSAIKRQNPVQKASNTSIRL